MTTTPSGCTDTRLPQNLRDVCDDVWRNVPKPERRPVELPRAEWRGELRDWRECIAITDHNEPVFLTYFGGLDEVSGRMDGSQEGEMVFELIFHDHNRCTLSDTPGLGSDIYVSALDRQDDLRGGPVP